MTCASGLPEALSQARERQFDLVICDLFLEDTSGTEVLQAVRELQPACRTMLSTGSGVASDWRDRFGDLADEFLMKPVQPENLRAAIEHVLGEGS